MTLLEQATSALRQLHDLTSGMKTGSAPDAYSLLGIQSDLVSFYTQIGEEMASKFGAKERGYLARKIAEAQQYQKGRMNPASKIGDVTQQALLAVGEEYEREIVAAETYERYRTFLKSIQQAIEHSRQTISFIKTAESTS